MLVKLVAASRYTKQELYGEVNKSTVKARDLKTPFSMFDGTRRQILEPDCA